MTTIPYGCGMMSKLRVEQFTEALLSQGGRIALINQGGKMIASAPGFDVLSTEISAHPDFAQHEAIFLEVSPSTKLLMSAFLHRTCRGPAAGGTRAWSYSSMEELLRDGLRLSRGMTHKNASAHLWWGGGKGIINGVSTLGKKERGHLFREYGRFISDLRGCYFTAKDVGTTSDDVAEIYRTTRFVTCIPPEYGGSGNPSGSTAEGVMQGIEAVCDILGQPVSSMTVIVQGLGEVGSRLATLLLNAGAKVKAFDPSEARCQKVANLSPNIEVEPRKDEGVLSLEADILAPCALGGVLNDKTIPNLKVRAVCGAANNQLASSERDGESLKERGILYAPDFIVNRMGIVGCADEAFGWVEDDPEITRHLDKGWSGGVYQTTQKILKDALANNTTPDFEAVKHAEELSRQLHPMRGHRAFVQASQVAKEWTSAEYRAKAFIKA